MANDDFVGLVLRFVGTNSLFNIRIGITVAILLDTPEKGLTSTSSGNGAYS